MSWVDRVRRVNGGPLSDTLSRFKGYLTIKGAGVAQLRERYALQEVVAEGDIAAASVRLSGFADATDWCVHPEFVAVRHGDGRFLGLRRTQHAGFPVSAGALEQIYLCGVGVWMCMTAPLALRNADAEVEELGDWVENGEHWRRLRVASPPRGLAPVHATILYFDEEWMMRRVDFRSLLNIRQSMTIYCSAFQSCAGLTLPTLFRALTLAPDGGVVRRPPFLDIEIFEADYW
jgi:hypothetical protein